jgi:hypothetical protein
MGFVAEAGCCSGALAVGLLNGGLVVLTHEHSPSRHPWITLKRYQVDPRWGNIVLLFKYRLSKHVGLRFEYRDYTTPFPNRIIGPAPGSSLSGRAQNFLAMGGISGIF